MRLNVAQVENPAGSGLGPKRNRESSDNGDLENTPTLKKVCVGVCHLSCSY
jgi:hypothetical protein